MSVLYVGSSEISPILDVTQNQKTFNILEYKQSDHILNDIRWLRANTNSWQSGEMYESAYAALVEYKRTATLKSHTINNITVPYYLAENGFKIVVAEQAENVDNLYNTQGFADYFILDADNKQFKLPRRSNRRIIKSQKASKDNNYSWYNIYSDGWVEQGGKVLTVEDSAVDVVFPVEMADANQYLFHGNVTHELALNTASLYLKTITYSATGVSVVGVANMGATTIYQAMEFEWKVLGAAAESEYVDLDDVLYDYYYVGEFEQTALMQTAGIVSEQLNGLDKYIDDKVAESMSSAADYNDTEYIAHQAMPSNKYIDLTLGATDSYYTAPADGYFFVAKTGDINQFLNGYITPNNSTTRIIGTSRMASVNGTVLVLFLPVSKGQRLFLTYTATGDTTYFKFIYANGSK